MAESERRLLVIYLPNLASGGAERLHLHLAPEFVKTGFDVTFLLHHAQGALLPLVPPEAKIVSMNCGRTVAGLWPLTRYLRCEKPDILLSNLGHNNIVAIWAAMLAGVRTRVIASYHNTLSEEAKTGWKNRILLPLSRLFLWKAHGVVTVSQGVAYDLAKITGLPLTRITTIYNPVVFHDFDKRMAEPVFHPWLAQKEAPFMLAVGRLVAQKDFAMLIRAFAQVARLSPMRLIILGEGEMHASLLSIAHSEGVADRVSMPGFQPNPLPFMKAAALVAVSSRHEGFGNALVEALACGTPVVSTDCRHGPAEILEQGRYGLLVPVGDSDAMANAMKMTLDQPLPSEFLKKRGREFTVARAAGEYIALFNRLCF